MRFFLSFVRGIILLNLLLVKTKGESCLKHSNGQTKFGPACQYLCHCKQQAENCDVITGSCASGCADGWMGPGCQYRDIAIWEYAEMAYNSSEDATLANDGDLATCTRTISTTSPESEPHWWRLWLMRPQIIRGMIIVTEDAALRHFTKFTVFVYTSTREANNFNTTTPREICFQHNNASPMNTTIVVRCDPALMGNTVRIQLDQTADTLVLCDVRVVGGRNLAFSKPSSQSSTKRGYSPANVVDGVEQYNKSAGCTITGMDSPPWWSVDLGTVVHIQAVRITGLRFTTDLSGSMPSYKIQAATTKDSWRTVNESWHVFIIPDVNYTVNTTARYVRLVGTSLRSMELCELLVFGDCLQNRCGLGCDGVCHCSEFTFTSQLTGRCDEGCQVGWTGEEDRCDKECPNGTYDAGCIGRCGQCFNNNTCDPVDGQCPGRCQTGRTGIKCDQGCTEHEMFCKQCESCGGNLTCDNSEGMCPVECQEYFCSLSTARHKTNTDKLIVTWLKVIATVPGSLGLSLLVGLIACLVRRRRKAKQNNALTAIVDDRCDGVNDDAANDHQTYEDHIYVNMGMELFEAQLDADVDNNINYDDHTYYNLRTDIDNGPESCLPKV